MSSDLLSPTVDSGLFYTVTLPNMEEKFIRREELLKAGNLWFTYDSKTPEAGVYCRGPATIFQAYITSKWEDSKSCLRS